MNFVQNNNFVCFFVNYLWLICWSNHLGQGSGQKEQAHYNIFNVQLWQLYLTIQRGIDYENYQGSKKYLTKVDGRPGKITQKKLVSYK